MSLTSLALRTAARQALIGATLAGSNVFDTGGRIDETGQDLAQFSIVVDTGSVKGRQVVLSLTIAIHIRMVVEDEENGGLIAPWLLSPTSPQAERALDIVSHQVVATLKHGRSCWAKLFRSLSEVQMVQHEHGEPGLAQRTVIMHIDAEGEPAGDPKGPWLELVNELEANGDAVAAERLAIVSMLNGVGVLVSKLNLDAGVSYADVYASPEPRAEAIAKKKPAKGKAR
mgnify:CR=1 FL=1